MRRCQPIQFGDLWRKFVEENPQVERSLTEGRIPEVWRSVAGDDIAAMTDSVTFRNGTLTVHVTSSVVRQEIFMRRSSFVEVMNATLGQPIIKTIIVR
ncbi:MAG: DUF721 domain-containing protein [Tidjanibacter sp.]|nr:DUF721 domain-containing protein [Tidjanibacter sp.]